MIDSLNPFPALSDKAVKALELFGIANDDISDKAVCTRHYLSCLEVIGAKDISDLCFQDENLSKLLNKNIAQMDKAFE
ncbi:hypothetical protein MCHI_002870, partial [Candidatus Magnetoovum chiemensis]